MEPNQNQNSTSPIIPPQTQPVDTPSPVAPPQQPTIIIPSEPSEKSNNNKIIGIGVAVVVLILVLSGSAFYMLLNSPTNVATKASSGDVGQRYSRPTPTTIISSPTPQVESSDPSSVILDDPQSDISSVQQDLSNL